MDKLATLNDTSTVDDVLLYKRERMASAVLSFKGVQPCDEDVINHHGAGIQEGSRAEATQKFILRHGSVLRQHLVVQWLLDGQSSAERVAKAATEMHSKDQRAGRVRTEIVSARQLWFEGAGNEVHLPTTKKSILLVGAESKYAGHVELVDVRMTPQEAAEDARIDAKMDEASRKRFAVRAGVDHGQLVSDMWAACPLPAEYAPVRDHLNTLRPNLLISERLPTMSDVYWACFGALHCKPTPAQCYHFLHIERRAGEGMLAWAARFFRELELCGKWVDTTPAQLTIRFLAGVQQICDPIYHQILGKADGAPIQVAQARDDALRRWQAYEQADASRAVTQGPGNKELQQARALLAQYQAAEQRQNGNGGGGGFGNGGGGGFGNGGGRRLWEWGGGRLWEWGGRRLWEWGG